MRVALNKRLGRFFAIGALSQALLMLFDQIWEGIVLDFYLLYTIPGIAFGLLLIYELYQAKLIRFGQSFFLILLISIAACASSMHLAAYLFGQLFFGSAAIIPQEFLVGTTSGALGACLLSFIPNMLIRSIRIEATHLKVIVLGVIIGEFLFVTMNYQLLWIIGYGLWFGGMGSLIFNRIDRSPIAQNSEHGPKS